ncbi:OsmC family protein [bacterium]|nr:OsmC family protein [bacterium]
MSIRYATGEWHGNLKEGKGTLSTESGVFKNAPYDFVSRFESGSNTNPEELIAAAHAGCFSMALAHGLAEAGFTANFVRTRANVHLNAVEGKPTVNQIDLECEADVPNISAEQFQEIATGTKTGCPISRALAAVPINLNARLVASAS